MVFVSHATPEDNDLALWLTLQLASHGYPAWCDLTKLLGGEKFWEDIEDAIKNCAAKFVFLLSEASNKKRGTRDELDCAIGTEKKLNIKDFILTLRVDDLPYDDVYISIRRLNHIDFRTSWAHGLAQLLDKLEGDGVPTNPHVNSDTVCSWWRTQFSADGGVLEQPEEVLSNWFKVEDLPQTLNEHTLGARRPGPVERGEITFPYPAVWVSDASFLTFGSADDFPQPLQSNLCIVKTREHALKEIISGEAVRSGPKHLSHLLRLSWDEALSKHLFSYDMASGQRCYYATGGRVPDDTIHFVGPDGKKTWRSIVGYKTLPRERTRFWHYAVSGKPIIRPDILFFVKGHVLFSDDGQQVWNNKDAMGRARRNQCKGWWNDEWRDRMLAMMSYLGGGDGRIELRLGSNALGYVLQTPILFQSPVSYLQPEKIEKELPEYAFEDDNELDDFEVALEGDNTADAKSD